VKEKGCLDGKESVQFRQGLQPVFLAEGGNAVEKVRGQAVPIKTLYRKPNAQKTTHKEQEAAGRDRLRTSGS